MCYRPNLQCQITWWQRQLSLQTPRHIGDQQLFSLLVSWSTKVSSCGCMRGRSYCGFGLVITDVLCLLLTFSLLMFYIDFLVYWFDINKYICLSIDWMEIFKYCFHSWKCRFWKYKLGLLRWSLQSPSLVSWRGRKSHPSAKLNIHTYWVWLGAIEKKLSALVSLKASKEFSILVLGEGWGTIQWMSVNDRAWIAGSFFEAIIMSRPFRPTE